MADNLILVTVKSKIIGSDNIYRDNNVKPSNIITYTTPRQQAVDILNLTTPIRYNVSNGLTYFGVRDNVSQKIENRNVGICYYQCTDSITTLAAQSADLVSLTVVKRRLETIASEVMLFQTSKIIGFIDVNGSNSRFQYIEDGDPNLVMYEVTQTPAQIVAAGISPVFNFDGYTLYVNDIRGNDATAEYGNPLLPWATFDAAIAAGAAKVALIGNSVNVIVTGGIQTSIINFFSAGVNIYLDANTEVDFSTYLATGAGNQIITGKGSLLSTGTNGIRLATTFSGIVTIDIGTFTANGKVGVSNLSTSGGVINCTCDYSVMGSGCFYLYKMIGTSNQGSFIVNKLHIDNSTGRISTFYINPSSLIAGGKVFNFYIASGNSVSSNEGLLTVANIDATYEINADLNISYDGSVGSPGLNAILSCLNSTGGFINLKGNNIISNSGKLAILLNSTGVVIFDYSTTFQVANNADNLLILAGGTSLYTLYGKKVSNTHTSAISLGVTFTSANATTDFGTSTGTAGTDTLHFKGALKCIYMNVAAKGILIANANPNFIMDGGIIEMVNSNTLNDSISAATAQNIKVFGTGFVRGAVNGNIINTITGSNIIQDIGVVTAS